MAWVGVAAYCREKGIKSPQIIYNRIATGKMPKDEWREVEVVIKRKQVRI